MDESNVWPHIEKRWAINGLVIGWTPPKRPSETTLTTQADMIILHNSAFKGYGRTGDQKPHHFERDRRDFSYVPQGVDQYIQSKQPGDLLYLGFASSFREQFLEELTPSISLDEVLIDGRKLPNYDEISKLILGFLQGEGLGGRLYGESLACLAFSNVIQQFDKRSHDAPRYKIAPHKLNLITDYIDAHSDEQIGVDTLSEMAELSKFHFSKMFKLETGLSPHQYILRHRIQRAQGMLVRSRLSLAEISIEVGFSSQSHMTEAFRRVVGTSPGQYRKELGV